MRPLAIFSPKPCPDVDIHPLFLEYHTRAVPWRGVFDEDPAPNFFSSEHVRYVSSPKEAEAIVLPNNVRVITPEVAAYISSWADTAAALHVPVYVFSFGDFTDTTVFDSRVTVFKLSVYRHSMKPNEVIVPTTIRDFSAEGISVRAKRSVPLVSFCGYAGFKTRAQWVKYFVKNLYWRLRALCVPHLEARMLGIYWRRRLMRVLAHSTRVDTHFIVRRSFSGALRTIELSPEEARREFVQSIVDADFVLAPKGDGNYSNRFLETLALGRIPVVVDTDIVLPGEEYIDYDRIMVRIPMNEVNQADRRITAFYESLTEEEWSARQHEASMVCATELRQDRFFARYFSRYVQEGV